MNKDEFEKLFARSIRLWMEDDAAPDAERLTQAQGRLFPYEYFHQRDIAYFEDQGDATISAHLRPSSHARYYVIIQSSYRGNNAIYVAR